MATDIEPIDLTAPSTPDVSTTVRSPRPRWPLLAIVAVLGAAALWRLAASDASEGVPATTSAPPATTADRDPPSADPQIDAATPPDATSSPTAVAFEPYEGRPTGPVTLATEDETVRLWSVDLAAGRAGRLELPVIPGAAVVGVRFFGADRAVALLDDGDYATLRVGASEVTVDGVTDVGTRTSFGLEAVTPDGTAAWVAIESGLVRWDFATDAVDERWIDLRGDHLVPPQIRGVVGAGAVAEAAGRTFLVDGSGAVPLGVDGAVAAIAGDWVVTRRCDDVLRCGDLAATKVGSSTTVTLPSDRQFRRTCGHAAPGPDGALVLVVQRGASISVVTVAADGSTTTTDVHPIGLGCVDVAHAPGGVVIAHDWGLLVTGDGRPARVDLPALASRSPVIAVGVG